MNSHRTRFFFLLVQVVDILRSRFLFEGGAVSITVLALHIFLASVLTSHRRTVRDLVKAAANVNRPLQDVKLPSVCPNRMQPAPGRSEG